MNMQLLADKFVSVKCIFQNVLHLPLKGFCKLVSLAAIGHLKKKKESGSKWNCLRVNVSLLCLQEDVQ